MGDPNETFGERLGRLLRERGVDVPEAARILGVREGAVYKALRNDTQSIKLDAALRLCRRLGISPWELAGERDPAVPIDLSGRRAEKGEGPRAFADDFGPGDFQPSGAPTYEARRRRGDDMKPVTHAPIQYPVRTATGDQDWERVVVPLEDGDLEFVRAAVPYMSAETAATVLAHPTMANNTIRMAQRNGDVPSDLPRGVSLDQALLGIRVDLDRRIREHAVPPADGESGRQRFERVANQAAFVRIVARQNEALRQALLAFLDLPALAETDRRGIRETLEGAFEASDALQDR